MRLTEFSVKNYQFTIVIFAMVLALGITSLFTMPRGEDPLFRAPNFFIVAVYPGASPTDMEKLVADPIEEKLNELDNIKRIRSDIDDGLLVVQVEFIYSESPDEKYNEVVREVNSLRPALPADLLSLEIRKVTASDVSTYQLAFVTDSASYRALYDQADALKKEIEKIREVKKVKLHGYPDQQLRVSVDLGKMAQHRLSLNRVLGAIQSEAQNIPGGSIDAGGKKFNIKTSGDYGSVEEVRNTVVNASDGRIVYLRDIATVDMVYNDETYITRYNGKKAIFLTVSEKDRTNILEIQKKVTPLIDAAIARLPEGISLEQGFIQADDVGRRLSHFTRDFSIAILLVLITLLPLGSRASLVVMISIPLSIAIGLFLLNLFGFTINQLSIVGMIIALGLLVDDSIVVVENIERFLRNGYKRRDAAIKATSQISLAVLGCTAILIVAFLPIIFMPEGAGDFIRSLPMAVVLTIIASYFVSVTIVPFLSSLVLSDKHSQEGNVFLRGLQRVISGTYTKLLDRALKRPVAALLIALALFLGSLSLFGVVGFSLFPRSEKPMFLVNIETPIGTNLYKTDSIARYAEQVVLRQDKVKAVYTNVGKGNPRVYYNEIQRNETSNFSQLFVRLEPVELPELEAVVSALRDSFRTTPDARIEVKQFEQGPPIEAPIAIRVFGEDLDSLRAAAGRVEELLKSTEGTLYVNNPLKNYTTDLRLNINTDKAALLGIPTSEIDKTVRMGLAGLGIATYKDEEGEDYTINATLGRDKHPDLSVLDKLYVTSLTGALVPLGQLASVQFERAVPSIKHYNKNRYITITSYTQEGYNTAEVTGRVLDGMKTLSLPEKFSYMAAGEVESSAESFGGLGTIIVITIFGFLGILLLEFKTFKSTLIVLSVIPLGIIGAVVALLVSGNTLSFVAVVGLIALAGIEVKNSILLVDYTNFLRREGRSLDEAIHEAGETRFLPIILTTFTAIGGLIPLVLEHSPLYSPLAWVLIGGLISSLLLSRIVTPVLYKLLPPAIEQGS